MSNKEAFVCKICGASFRTSDELNYHVRTIHGASGGGVPPNPPIVPPKEPPKEPPKLPPDIPPKKPPKDPELPPDTPPGEPHGEPPKTN